MPKGTTEKRKKTFLSKNVFNGTHGYVLIDGVPVMEIIKFEAKLKTNRENLQFANEMTEDTKLMSLSGEFSYTCRKVYTRAQSIASSLKNGNDPRVTIQSTNGDPDALGVETLTISNCWYNDLSLMQFETGKLVEEEFSGGFTDWKYDDVVKPTTTNIIN